MESVLIANSMLVVSSIAAYGGRGKGTEKKRKNPVLPRQRKQRRALILGFLCRGKKKEGESILD